MVSRRRRWIAAVPVILLTVGVATACSSSSSAQGNQKEKQQQNQITKNLENTQGLPDVFYSQERQNLIDIELAEVNDVRTTSFFTKDGNVDPVGQCPSIGFGIPDSASLSNPTQIQYSSPPNNGGTFDPGVVDQMDPNGIYAPTASEGTFVICVNVRTGQAYIDRIEDRVDTYGGPAAWNYTTHSAALIGDPTALAATGNGADRKNTKITGRNGSPLATANPTSK